MNIKRLWQITKNRHLELIMELIILVLIYVRKMQESGLVEIIPLLCILTTQGQYLAFS